MFIRSLLFIALVSLVSAQTRSKRSVAPFLGAGGSRPSGMAIPRDHWHCGSDEISRAFSYNYTHQHCPSLAAALNHCCAIHDDCYGQRLGQEKCDADFCECNRMATRLPTEEGYICRSNARDICVFLDLVGSFAYSASNYSDPSSPSGNLLVAPSSAPELEKAFMDLYSDCPFVNITLASCATNFDLCSRVHSVDFCANDLCHCTLDAAEMDMAHNKTCHRSVAHTCRLVLQHSSDILTSQSIMRNFIIIGLFLVAMVAIGSVVYFMYNRTSSDRKKAEEGKYLQIHTVESSRSVNPLLASRD